MRRVEAVTAVRDGASITGTARRLGISRATLHRWLKAYDPAHPMASLRPKQRGPKAPRWGDDVIEKVMNLIADHPDWWGKRRVAQALRHRDVTLSEATVGRILVVARQRIAEKRHRETRRQQVEQRRQAGVMTRRHERDEARRTVWRERLKPALAPGLPVEERLHRVAHALASKGWKIQVKDLTPELQDIADAYLAHFGKRDIVAPSERWLVEADRSVPALKDPKSSSGLSQQIGLKRGPNIDDLRVGALNHLAKNFGPAALPPARNSISDGDPSKEIGRRARLSPVATAATTRSRRSRE